MGASSGWVDDPWQQHRERAAEVLDRARSPVVAGFGTAAALHGLPMIGDPPSRVELIVPRSGGGRITADRRVRALPLDPDEVTTVNGLPVTTVPRTLFDLAASAGRVHGLIAADDALRRRLCSLADVAACVTRHPGRHGRTGVAFVLDHADGRSRSPATTMSRFLMWSHGRLPRPELDEPVLGFGDEVIGSADFSWDGGRVLGLVDDGPADSTLLTPQAELELDPLGVTVVRWGIPEIENPQQLYLRLHGALDRRIPRAWS